MRRSFYLLAVTAACTLVFASCEPEEALVPTTVVAPEVATAENVPPEIVSRIASMGFSPKGIEVVDEGYRIEGDIIITRKNLADPDWGLSVEKQYSTNTLVSTNGNRTITMYAAEGRRGYSPGMIAGLDLAIARFNAENLEINFVRTINSRSADIVMTRLSRRDERRGVLGSAGFPSASGDPYNEIKMSGVLESSYGLSTEGIATIIAHEMGHCIGFRHTDYFDRSVSCGGGTSNEGVAGVGANHIPGTPTGARLSDGSWMLACSDGSDRPFNNDDKVALDFLY